MSLSRIAKILGLSWLALAPAVWSQTDGDAGDKKEDAEAAAEKALRYKDPPIVPITEEERKSNCKKFEKEFISFYDKVFYIKDCKKYHLTTDESSQLTRKKVRPLDVDARAISSLSDAGEYSALIRLAPNCKKFDGTYISFNLIVYYVEKCKYRQFPDEASYQEHRRKNKLIDRPILYPDGPEFATLKEGIPFPSILDEETGDKKPDFAEIISISEACRDITGRFVSYLDSIYLINRFKSGKGCWREKIDASEYSRKITQGKVLLRELTSTQARSIPDYDPSDPTVQTN